MRFITAGLMTVWGGLGRIWAAMATLWVAPNFDPPRYPGSAEDAIREDWQRVGDHLRTAMGKRPTLREYRERNWPGREDPWG